MRTQGSKKPMKQKLKMRTSFHFCIPEEITEKKNARLLASESVSII